MTHFLSAILLAAVLIGSSACGAELGDPDDGVGDGSGGGNGGGMGDGSGNGGDGDTDPAADGSFLSTCDPNNPDTCQTDFVCFEFNQRGPHCTHACNSDGDCDAPSTGCSGMGVCKAP